MGDLGINVYKEYEEQINCFFETPNIEVAPNDITPVDNTRVATQDIQPILYLGEF